MFCNYCGAPNPDVASFCNKCGKATARASASPPVQAELINYVMKMAPPSVPVPVVLTAPVRQETRAAIRGTLTPAARTEFTDGLIAELRRQIEDKCFPGAIAAWIITLIAVGSFSIPELGQQWGVVIGLVTAFVVAGIVFKIVKGLLEDKCFGRSAAW